MFVPLPSCHHPCSCRKHACILILPNCQTVMVSSFTLVCSILLVFTCHASAAIVTSPNSAPNPVSTLTGYCTAETNTTHQTLPVIMYVTNLCNTVNIYMCLEYHGAFQYIRDVSPGRFAVLASQLGDCWSFRADSCSGRQLFQHSLRGSRKFSIGCTIEDIDVQRIGPEHDVPVECTLTNVPLLTDVYDAAKHHLTKAIVNWTKIDDSHIVDDLQNPLQFVDRTEFLRSVYAHSVSLARHGIPLNTSLTILEHARALILHTERCKSFLIGTNIGIPRSYLALYGVVAALIEARAMEDNTWIPNVADLTEEQQVVLNTYEELAAGASLLGRLPLDYNPPEELLVNHNSSQTSRTNRMLVSNNDSVVRSSATYKLGVTYCKQFGKDWVFFRQTVSGASFDRSDCCTKPCIDIEKYFQVFGGTLALIQRLCCSVCNKARCDSSKHDPYVKSMLLRAEIFTGGGEDDSTPGDTVTFSV